MPQEHGLYVDIMLSANIIFEKLKILVFVFKDIKTNLILGMHDVKVNNKIHSCLFLHTASRC